MNRLANALLVVGLLALIACANDQAEPAGDRSARRFDLADAAYEWRFLAGDEPDRAAPDFDDKAWQRVEFPHNWLAGTSAPGRSRGWYRLRFVLPADWSNTPLTLRLGPIVDVDETYFNGRRVDGTGTFGPGFQVGEHAYDRVRLYEIPPDLARYGEENVLAIRVQTAFDYSGGFAVGGSGASIGSPEVVRRRFYEEQFLDFALVVLMITVGAYFFLLFLRLPRAYNYLVFALCCTSLAVYVFLRTQLKYEIIDDFLFLKRAEYFSLCLLAPTFFNFLLLHISKTKKSRFERIFVIAYNVLAGAIPILALVSDDLTILDLVNRVLFLPVWAIGFLFSLYYLALRARLREPDARAVLMGTGLVVAGFASDTLAVFGLVPWGMLGKTSFLIMILTLAAVLANRMVLLQEKVERNAADMGTLYAGSRLILEGHDLHFILTTLLGSLPFRLTFLYEFDSTTDRYGELGRVEDADSEIQLPSGFAGAEYENPEALLTATRDRTELTADLFSLEKESEIIGILVGLRGPQPLDRDTREHIASTLNLLSLLVANRRLQSQLLAKERLSALGGAASAIVHDLKGPMHIIQGYATYLADPDTTAEERRQYVDEITAEIEEMDRMTREILEYSRDEIELNRSARDIGAFLDELAREFRIRPEKNGIDFHLRTGEALTVPFDDQRLRRVLLNLLGNATDSLAGVENARLELGYAGENGHCRLFVRDNGPGIPEEIRDTLFDPFVTHGKSEGTGLGTAIAKKITEAHGGRIWYETSTGAGTTFYLELPTE